MTNILAVLIARGGSKGIKNKNLAPIGGRPLFSYIYHTCIEASKEKPLDLIFSTDCPKIRDAALELGAWAPFLRPAHLAADNVPSWPVVQHAIIEAEKIKNRKYDLIVYLQPTSPLCRPQDIVSCIETLEKEPHFDSAVAVTEVETHPFRMKRLLGGRSLVNYIDQGFEDMRPRQQLPKVYRRAGSVYASRRNIIFDQNTLVAESCAGIVVPPETAVDVDNPIDLQLVRLLFQNASTSEEVQS
jgi:CMP-N,N'-diacetyllegionaminic acid synthase